MKTEISLTEKNMGEIRKNGRSRNIYIGCASSVLSGLNEEASFYFSRGPKGNRKMATQIRESSLRQLCVTDLRLRMGLKTYAHPIEKIRGTKKEGL